MLISIKLNTEALELLEKVYSSILYKNKEEQNFDQQLAFETFTELKKIIDVNELPGEYFVIHKMLENSYNLKLRKEMFPFRLSYNLFNDSLTVSLDRLLSVYQNNVIDIVERLGGNTDLSIPLNYRQALDLVYSKAIEKFKDIDALTTQTLDGMSYVEQLKTKIDEILTQTIIIAQSEILLNGMKIGRNNYRGAKGVKEFIDMIPSIYQERFPTSSLLENTTSLTSQNEALQFKQENKLTVQRLFDFNLPPLDDVCYVRTGDIISLIANEGVGKTTMAVMLAMNAIYEGHDVLFMTGESPKIKICNMCVSHHLFKLFGYRVTWQELLNKEFRVSLPMELQKAINFAEKDLVENPKYGKMHLRLRFAYETFYEDIKTFHNKYPNMKTVVIDHTDKLLVKGILTSNGYLNDQKKKVDYLFDQEIFCKSTLPVAIINLAHTGSDAAKAIERGKATGVRVGSSSGATSKDADMVILMKKDGADFVSIEVPKLRDFRDSITPFLLKKDFSACNFIYDLEFQHKVDMNVEDDLE